MRSARRVWLLSRCDDCVPPGSRRRNRERSIARPVETASPVSVVGIAVPADTEVRLRLSADIAAG
jgi:hypothetical protein